MRFSLKRTALAMACLFLLGVGSSAAAAEGIRMSRGQVVYVPAYSNVFSGDRAMPFNLAVMLSLRNVDRTTKIEVLSVDYYDKDGKFLNKYLDKPMVLGPLASDHVYVRESDESGGFGACFLVRWKAAEEVVAPIFESVMIGARSGQGISFIRQGQVLEELGK